MSSLFAVLAVFDRKLFLLLNAGVANPFFDFVFVHATEATFWIIPGCAILLFFIIRKKKEALPVIGMALCTVAVSDPVAARLLKPLFGRYRPCHPDFFVAGGHFLCGMKTSLSFPSVHAVNVFAQATLLTFFYPKWKWVFFSFAVFIGYSRIYVGVHYPADVAAGAAAGVVIGMVTFQVYRIIRNRWNARLQRSKGTALTAPGISELPGREPDVPLKDDRT